MAKKPIESKHEFIKFIKELYTEEIQLNFDNYFYIIKRDNIYHLDFPTQKYYYIDGELNIDSCSSLKTWIDNLSSAVRINNDELDSIRKRKLGDFDSLDSSNNYIINFVDGTKFELTPDPIKLPNRNYSFTHQCEIPKEYLDNRSVLTVYLNESTNEFNFDDEFDGSELLLETAIKNLKILFKKEATYKIYTTDKDDEGFRIVAIEAKGNLCTLRQYFKVI